MNALLRTIRTVLLLSVICTLPVSGWATAVPGRPGNTVEFDKARNSLSVHLEDADIADVARTLAAQADIRVYLDETLTQKKITARFSNVPAEEGIKRLLGPINSAFVFSRISDDSGQTKFRLDMVRIFADNNLTGASYRRFSPDGASAKQVRKNASPASEEIREQMMRAKQNLELIRRKRRAETDHANREIARIKASLNRTRSPEERAGLVRELSRATQELGQAQRINNRLIMDEERNLRLLAESSATSEGRRKFMERQQQARQQQAAASQNRKN